MNEKYNNIIKIVEALTIKKQGNNLEIIFLGETNIRSLPKLENLATVYKINTKGKKIHTIFQFI